MKKVMVVMGGMSSERSVSLMSGAGVAAALTEAGYNVVSYDLTSDIDGFVQTVYQEKPDVVFNALHGRYGEDGCIQGLLNLIGVPYTHSGVMASSVGMNKEMTRRIAQAAGITVAEGRMVSRAEVASGQDLPMPYVIKPNDEGSSMRVSIIRTPADKEALLKEWPADKKMLMEGYVPGRELSAVVLDDQAVGVVEVIPKKGYYDFNNKYTAGAADHVIPAPIPQKLYDQAMSEALSMHRLLMCEGTSRSDFRLDDVTDPSCPRLVFLEINTNPGMTKVSLVPEVVRICDGMSYQELVVHLVEGAACGK